MSVMLFVIVLVASFMIVRVGAVAFQLTGLEWSLAKFQALSCFSGTGFTTKEAELITGNKQRRRIASILMVLGNAGLVSMIAAIASALNPQYTLLAKLSEFFLPFSIPGGLAPWINLGIIILAVYLVYRVFMNRKFLSKLTILLRRKIVGTKIFRPVSFEELLFLTGGYGVSRIDVGQSSPIANKTLAESRLRKKDIAVLAIVRADTTLPNPDAGTEILPGDELISFGKMENMRKQIGATDKKN